MTKWQRLYNSFVDYQNRNQCSNKVLNFIQSAMQPSLYVGNEECFQGRRNELNKRLSFAGLELAETGKFKKVVKAQTISEAEQRADKFKYKLENRNTHEYIFRYCRPELMAENYFHAVFEATKSIADRLREITGVSDDGAPLVNNTFSTNTPLIKINDLVTETERSEHIGLSNVIKGVFSLIRNPTAHEPKLKFVILEDEALDIMSMISYIHKRLDKASAVHNQ